MKIMERKIINCTTKNRPEIWHIITRYLPTISYTFKPITNISFTRLWMPPPLLMSEWGSSVTLNGPFESLGFASPRRLNFSVSLKVIAALTSPGNVWDTAGHQRECKERSNCISKRCWWLTFGACSELWIFLGKKNLHRNCDLSYRQIASNRKRRGRNSWCPCIIANPTTTRGDCTCPMQYLLIILLENMGNFYPNTEFQKKS